MPELRDKILMCPPTHFSVDYVINPWMAGQKGSLNEGRAQKQWETLRDALGEHAEIVLIDPQPDLPDMVFTANAGVVYGDKAIASHFMPHERRPEEPHFKKWFRDNGFELLNLDEKIGFEGAGDCLLDRGGKWLWTGYGFRTEIEAHAEIQKFFDIEVVSIRLTDSRFYHIDTCFCPLNGGFLMYHPPAFDFDSRIAIESRIPSHKRIVVDTMDAGNFACNAVNIGDMVFLNKASDPLKARLMLAGFKVREINLSEFLKAGGSAKCLTLKLTEPVKA
ncbi:MAG: dimethylarginine dimethylaminohydrolase family protein [Gammaproteobacteria bacterium]|nr:dimethylarginine dimethylaminohydrolase family protein [Gammaproteobacteria bacterium]MDH4256592.1 dimethylarginine dimethylaminohydrolase family protein [Gammaproteobacteria bacterium]MDH5310266.1 dimethylarginine dimethylaminohydrolase family protein [Gammaproteobacteria bacterium]